MVLVLVFSALLLTLGGAVLSYAATEKTIASYHTADVRLYYITESGLVAGLAVLQADFSAREDFCGSVGDGTFTVKISTEPCGAKLVRSTGTLDGYSRTLTARTAYDPEKGFTVLEFDPGP